MSSSSSSQFDNSTMNDVLLYAQSRLTRKQAVREIGEVVLRSNMKPRTVEQALQLIKAILPPDNTLPNTVQELFGAMLSSENDWRLAQYLIRHKQQPTFSNSSPQLWNNNSTSNPSNSTTLSELPPSIFFPTIVNSSESESDNENASASSNSNSDSDSDNEGEGDDDDDDEDEDEDDEENEDESFFARLRQVQQQQSASTSASSSVVVQLPPSQVETGDPPRSTVITGDSTALTTEQRSQIASNSLNRFPFLGSFKRQRSESSSSNEPSLLNDFQILDEGSDDDDDDDDDDDENSFYSLNNNQQSNSSNMKSCCFEMNGYDLLDGGSKRRRH